jgi:hypothetical protein
MSAVPLADLYERVKQSELGSQWVDDPLMQQDVWPLTALGFDEEYCRIQGAKKHPFHTYYTSLAEVFGQTYGEGAGSREVFSQPNHY